MLSGMVGYYNEIMAIQTAMMALRDFSKGGGGGVQCLLYWYTCTLNAFKVGFHREKGLTALPRISPTLVVRSHFDTSEAQDATYLKKEIKVIKYMFIEVL